MVLLHREHVDNTSTSDLMLPALVVFTTVYFVFRDFGIRMIFGYLLLGGFTFLSILYKAAKNVRIPFTTVHLYYLILVAFIAVEFLRPDSRHDADTFSYVISMFLSFALVLCALPTIREIRFVLRLFCVAAVAFSFYVIFFRLKSELFWDNIYPLLSSTAADYLSYYVPKGYSISIGGITYTNYIIMLGASAAISLYYVEKKENVRYRVFYLLAMVFFTFSMVMTGRRGEFVGIILSYAVFYVFSGDCIKGFRRCILIILLAAAGVGMLVSILPLLKNIGFLYRYMLTFEKLISGSDVTSGRIELYQLAWKLFKEKPVLGIGWAKFSDFIPKAFRLVHGEVDDVHNIYLQFLCETGVLGTCIIIPVLIAIYVKTYKLFSWFKKTREHGEAFLLYKRAISVSFFLQTFLLIMGIYDPCFERLVFWCFYGIAVIMSNTTMCYQNKLKKT